MSTGRVDPRAGRVGSGPVENSRDLFLSVGKLMRCDKKKLVRVTPGVV